MQRCGPPPAYPNLKIPGVNIPIPQSIKYRADGESGLFKDQNQLTVYADCHGLNKAIYEQRQHKQAHWGEIPEGQEEASEEEEDQELYSSSEEESEEVAPAEEADESQPVILQGT